MPVMDRWEAVRTLKKDPRTRNIPIIGMSAYAEASERERRGSPPLRAPSYAFFSHRAVGQCERLATTLPMPVKQVECEPVAGDITRLGELLNPDSGARSVNNKTQ
jgi:CheY-like chemotaxis protein